MDLTKKLDTAINVDRNFRHISYTEKINRAKEELMATDPKKVIKRGRDEWDNLLGGIYGGKLYVIGADTGIGKSTFINQICNNISNQGVKVVKYSLEDRMEDIGKEELFYEANRLRKKDGLSAYTWIKFVNNEYNDGVFWAYVDKASNILCNEGNIQELDKEKQVSIDDLCVLMENACNDGVRVFAIDHLHYFEHKNTGERHDLMIENTMHKINEIARKYNVAVFIIAHYKKNIGNKLGEPSYDYFKDGAAIKQVANIIVQITRDITDEDSETDFHITKLRGPITPKVMSTKFDKDVFKYDFQERKAGDLNENIF